MKSKAEIQIKIHELEDHYLYLDKNGKLPLTADELRLKAEALRWVLGIQSSL